MYLDIINTIITSSTQQRPIYLLVFFFILLFIIVIIVISIFISNVLSVIHLCSLFVWICFRFFHFFYTNWWLFTVFVHHMLTERFKHVIIILSTCTLPIHLIFVSVLGFFFVFFVFISVMCCWVEEKNLEFIHRSSFSYIWRGEKREWKNTI